MNWGAIILAGGSGQRMKAGMNKVLLPVSGIPMIVRSVLAFIPHASHLVIVCRDEDHKTIQELLEQYLPNDTWKCLIYAPGGQTRQDSVLNGLKAMPESCDYIMVHDGARCLVDAPVILRSMQGAETHGSGVAAIAATDTIKIADDTNTIASTPDRATLRVVQTPQSFRRDLLEKAYQVAQADGFVGTDDASLLEHAGFPVQLTQGSRSNIKLTTPEDMRMAEAMMKPVFPTLRIGQGYDVHRLVENRDLILCGVKIPHSLGLLGHSDADVALHALMDAMLGAAALGDIGRHFPDTDEQYRGISSMLLLEHVHKLLIQHGLTVANADVTIVAQKPKLLPYIQEMRHNIAHVLRIDVERINVKATTTEKLGFEGEQLGISAQAVCLLQCIQ